mmetsp:Transcript_8694/g.13406  ORF Transcript_8694/g.13406 Transcript_8694/m.13406 type:complete len:163 (-) Transcript_8694:66-554(-)
MMVKLASVTPLALAFCAGILIGGAIQCQNSNSKNVFGPTKGVVLELADVPFRKTSHIDEEGRPIVKQQLFDPFLVPNFVGFSVATFKPGQIMMPPHQHKSLHEFFYVVEGTGVIQKDGVDHQVKAGTFLHMAPFEKHGIYVPKEAIEDMKMVVCGVTVGEEK